MQQRIRKREGGPVAATVAAVPNRNNDSSTFAAIPSGNNNKHSIIHDNNQRNKGSRFEYNKSLVNPRVFSIAMAIILFTLTTFLLHAPLSSSSSSRNLVPLFDATSNNTTATTVSTRSGRLVWPSSGYRRDAHDEDALAFKLDVSNNEKDDEKEHSIDSDDDDDIECRYDGHCPVGQTCAVKSPAPPLPFDNPEKLPGICLQIPIASSSSSVGEKTTATQICLDACRQELEMDEHFFHETFPKIIGHDATLSTSGRPKGCILYYKRTPDHMDKWQDLHNQDEPWLEKLYSLLATDPSSSTFNNNGYGMSTPPQDILPSIKAWEEQRFRHIVRVDPAPPDAASDDTTTTWMAYCTEPCQTDNDCQPTTNDPITSTTSLMAAVEKPFVCQQGACQRNSGFWEVPMTVQQKQQQRDKHGGQNMVFVTGATSSFFKGLQNLMGSIRYWASHCKVVVYNLGKLKPEQKDWIRQQPNLLSFEWQDGIPEKYPPHVHLGKKYAWKPIIIQETLAKYKMIFWLDAGSVLRGPITPIENIVKHNGIVLFHGQDESMTPRSHFKSYEWFNFTKDTMITGPHISGNTQVYLSPSRYVESLVNCNARCAMDPNCIAPNGAGLHNHRFDQTTLSLCAYHPNVWPNHHTEYLASVSKRLPKDARVASYKIIFTARQTMNAYTKIQGNYLLDAAQNKSDRRQFTYSTI